MAAFDVSSGAGTTDLRSGGTTRVAMLCSVAAHNVDASVRLRSNKGAGGSEVRVGGLVHSANGWIGVRTQL